jgi:hypothetical protein
MVRVPRKRGIDVIEGVAFGFAATVTVSPL